MSKQYVKCLTDIFEHMTKGKLYEVLEWNADGLPDHAKRCFTVENDEGQEDYWWLYPKEFELVEKRSVKPLTEYEQRYILDRPNDSSRSLARELWGEAKRKSSINDFRKRVKESVEGFERTLADVKVDATGANTETVSDAVRELIECQQKSRAGMTKAANGGVKEVFDKTKKRAEEHDNSRILLISDMHIPYHHPDTVEFLQHLKEKYNPTLVVCLGDELDKHALSYHDSDPDLPSAGDELRMSLPVIAQLHELFPRMDILDSNHGSLVWRKAKTHGIPKHYIKSYRDVLEVDEGWNWHYDMTLDLPNGQKVYLCHGKMSDITKMSQQMGMCAVAGHYHQSYKIEYWGNSFQLYWGLQAGCLIDDKSLAFAYNNTNLKRPVIGTGLIIDGQPILEPLLMGDDGRWVGRKK
jgi:predicted phosphodiesterase